ncbi:hypothetical protein H7X46_17050 [Pseudonocardia sp. C8]|uniref:DUF6457 domain-containing protein n=1 Tax=Pseudonocardia sp. C8 TaxID=2762759 RepID=UPI0016429916|nr:DUF6457 domain-containing protein [Pseudonocardia sp. C8]MBC3192775.1 hypothetical protein [Pseudonocardia sp. C8]
MATHEEIGVWLGAVERELGLHGTIESAQGLDAVAELTGLVADRVGPEAAGRTAFLVGAAAGRAEEPPVAARDFTDKVAALARSWNADTERAAAPHDPGR